MSIDWPNSQGFWRNKRVIVTGGSGFLGSFVVDKLRERGAAEIIVPRRTDYDLRDIEAIRRLFSDTSPGRSAVDRQLVVIHLAAHVGGIGANRAKPAEFFYDNLMMGVPLMHEALYHALSRLVGTSVAPSFSARRPGDVMHSLADIGRARALRATSRWWSGKRAWPRPLAAIGR